MLGLAEVSGTRRRTDQFRWRAQIDPPASGAANMALDHALASSAEPGRGVLRIYRWTCPTISFGRNEPALGRYQVERALRAGIEFVRRPTGGRAVFHDRELTYAVVLPVARGMSLRSVYQAINRGLASALRALGVRVDTAGAEVPVVGPDAGPCFDKPAPGELTVGGRKLVGSAQARVGGAILQHGSLLIGSDQERLSDLCVSHSEARAAIGLEEVLGDEPGWGQLVEVVIEGMREVLGGEWHRGGPMDVERSSSRELREHYASPEWTWRR